jgi:aspartate/methionine/tyrosine aminotransferase
MDFEEISYIAWFKSRQPAAVDLCRSGVEAFPLAELNLDWRNLELTGKNFYGYIPLLREIANKYGLGPNNVVSTLGTTHALFLVCAALLREGDEVCVEMPAYEPLLAVPRSFGGRLRRFMRPFETGFQPDIGGLEKDLTDRTRLVLLTNLHNPSGVYLEQDIVRSIAVSAGRRGIPVCVDEVYLDFMEGKKSESSFHLADNIIVISSLTKVYGLGGLRCGWILAKEDMVRKIRRIVDHTNIEGVFIGEQIAFQAMEKLKSIKDRNRERLSRNLDLIQSFIDSEGDLAWKKPDGGSVCFPRILKNLDGDDLARRLREKYNTAVVPGSFFEMPEFIRLGFSEDSTVLERGLEAVRAALKS